MPPRPYASRPLVSGLVLFSIPLVLAWLAPNMLPVLFAAVLVATALYGCAHWLARRTGMWEGLALALVCIAVIGGLIALGLTAAPVLTEQGAQLWEQLPRAAAGLRARAEQNPLVRTALEQFSVERALSALGEVVGGATTAAVSTFGALGTFAFIVVLGVFLAADPDTYSAGVLSLVAPSGRVRAAAVLRQLTHTLRGWLVAQLLSMAVIGALTTIGLWLLGVPLAVVLGVIAALLTFIPNLGPILAAVPALLLALAAEPTRALWVAALYVGVQVIEGNVTTPLIQQRTISLPPALILAAQLLLGGLYGLLGLALATPLVAAVLTLVQLLYVHGFLGTEPGRPAAEPAAILGAQRIGTEQETSP